MISLISLIFSIFLHFSSSNPINLPLSKSQIACNSFGEIPSRENAENLIFPQNHASPGEFPFAVGIRFVNRSDDQVVTTVCNGVLISERFVLTAAHCLLDPDFKAAQLIFGRVSLDLNNNTDPGEAIERKIESNFIIHPNFTEHTKKNDLALIRLEIPVNFSHFVFPACLNEKNENSDGISYLNAGFGEANFDFRLRNVDWLKKNQLRNFKHTYSCQDYFTFAKITKKHLCAIGEDRAHELCEGASGGPLGVWQDGKFYLHGILAFGKGCGGLSPTVFMRISSYFSWIEEIVWPLK